VPAQAENAVLMFKTPCAERALQLRRPIAVSSPATASRSCRFLASPSDRVPDAKTGVLLSRRAGAGGQVQALSQFDGNLRGKLHRPRRQILDWRPSVPGAAQSQHARWKQGYQETQCSEEWADKPAKRAQKTSDARWTKKHGKSIKGYKNT